MDNEKKGYSQKAVEQAKWDQHRRNLDSLIEDIEQEVDREFNATMNVSSNTRKALHMIQYGASIAGSDAIYEYITKYHSEDEDRLDIPACKQSDTGDTYLEKQGINRDNLDQYHPED